jgi:VIT1/CCC1 family predicted Fe2+/Mn2+ transporter
MVLGHADILPAPAREVARGAAGAGRYAAGMNPVPPDAGEGAPVAHHHRNIQGGGPRAAVFGVSDGLVTNVSLILGFAGASAAPSVVRLAGIAGLVSGAFSMAAGEYLSMQAQRELIQRELDIEREALRHEPEQEAAELRALYEHRGLDPKVAQEVVSEVSRDPELALETHAREELGVTPATLAGPYQAAVASFFTFALGALLPLLPWFVTSGTVAVVASIAIGAVASLAVGALLGVLTGRSIVRRAFRQLFITGVAAGVTYGVGRAVGAA